MHFNTGRPLPKHLEDAPIVELGNELYFNAYNDLASCRYYEGGEIPWTAINEYIAAYDFDEDQISIIHDVIIDVDKWFLKLVRDRAEKKAKKDKPSGDNKNGRHKQSASSLSKSRQRS